MDFNKIKLNLILKLSSLILFIYLVFRLKNQAKILSYFPLDITNDISSHIAQLYFLKVCGFHNLCNYWYNGYYLFKFYPPGWFFFSYPLLLIFKRPELATYISIILMLIIIFITIYKIVKLKQKSWLYSISFFLFLFGTAPSISAFFRLGRVTELFAWMIFLILTYTILKYKDKKIDVNFIYFIPFYTILLFSHPTVAIIFHFLLLSLILVKLRKLNELILIISSIIISIILSSFWWYPFINNLESGSRTYEFLPEITNRFFDINGQWTSTVILITLLPLISIVMFFIYFYSKHKDKKELLFYCPILILGFLVVTKLVTLIPYLNYVYPEPYFIFFIIFILIFLFFTEINNLPHLIQKLILVLIFIISILSTLVSINETSYYLDHTDLEKNTLELLKKVEGTYVIFDPPSNTSYVKSYYSYAAIYNNLSTPSGWSTSELTEEYNKLLNNLTNSFRNYNCSEFKELSKELNLDNIIAYNEKCNIKEICNLKEKTTKDNICLIKI